MVKMSPQQESEYALGFGVARNSLSNDAQLAHDHLTAERRHAGIPPDFPQADAAGSSRRSTISRWNTMVGTAALIPLGPGCGAVLVPWMITDWQASVSAPLALRDVGGFLIAAGGLLLVVTWVRFAT